MAPYLRPALAGAAATLAGIGLARFSYVPIFPAMVAASWIDPVGAGLVGAANLAGYLTGALGGRLLARRIGTACALDAGMGLAALAFAACAWNGGITYLAIWRGIAGVAGGILMALAGPAVQRAVEPTRRGQAGGIVVSGVGTGAVLSALCIPSLLPLGLPLTWLGLSLIVTLLWLLARSSWPDAPIPPVDRQQTRQAGVLTLLLSYALSAAGMVAHMVYLLDYAVRGRGFSVFTGSAIWLAFGLGAIVGTLAGGRAADRWGSATALRIWLVIQIGALVAALAPSGAALALSGWAGGFAGVGISAVGLARARDLGGVRAGSIWGAATAAYAAAQAGTAFGLAALFANTGSHVALFVTCLGLSVAGLLIALRP